MSNLDRFSAVVALIGRQTRQSIDAEEMSGLLAGIVHGLAVAVVSAAEADPRRVSDAVDIASNQLTEICAAIVQGLQSDNSRIVVPSDHADRWRF